MDKNITVLTSFFSEVFPGHSYKNLMELLKCSKMEVHKIRGQYGGKSFFYLWDPLTLTLDDFLILNTKEDFTKWNTL